VGQNLPEERKSGPLQGKLCQSLKDSKYIDNKELLIIPGASHTDLYDGGGKGAIPFDKLQSFFEEYLR
jgi:fermentation-respiration switch protein FrsA (DUF1100 family)